MFYKIGLLKKFEKFYEQHFYRAPANNSSVIGKRENVKTGVSRKENTPNFPKNEKFLRKHILCRSIANNNTH